MSAFGSNYIRLDCNNLSEEQEKQFYECCGIMLDDYGSFEDKLTDKELNNIYAIISVLLSFKYCISKSLTTSLGI